MRKEYEGLTSLSGRSCVCIVLSPPLFRTARFSALRCPRRHQSRSCWPQPQRKAGPLGTVRLGKEEENTITSLLTWNSPISCDHRVIRPSNPQGNPVVRPNKTNRLAFKYRGGCENVQQSACDSNGSIKPARMRSRVKAWGL